MGNYLVTGGAGFIGSAISNRLISDGHRVSVLDNLSTGFRENLDDRVHFVEADCRNSDSLNSFEGTRFDAIFHLAAQSSGEVSFDDPIFDLQCNAQSTLQLLRFAERSKCPRMIFASSMSTYGLPERQPVHESDPCTPASFYGVGKLASEHFLRISSQFGVRSVALRLFNVYGPGQNLENLRQGMVSIYLAQALRGKRIEVRGSAERFRDFVFIEDVVDAFLRARDYSDTPFAIFNICTGRRTTVGELLDILQQTLPERVEVTFSGTTLGDVLGCVGNNERALTELGWKPNVQLREGLREMVDAASRVPRSARG